MTSTFMIESQDIKVNLIPGMNAFLHTYYDRKLSLSSNNYSYFLSAGDIRFNRKTSKFSSSYTLSYNINLLYSRIFNYPQINLTTNFKRVKFSSRYPNHSQIKIYCVSL